MADFTNGPVVNLVTLIRYRSYLTFGWKHYGAFAFEKTVKSYKHSLNTHTMPSATFVRPY